jgi:hypothetical protein
MFRFSKIAWVAVVCGVGIFAISPPAHAQIQGRLIYGHYPQPQVIIPIPSHDGLVSTHSPSGNQPITVGTFTLQFFLGTSSGKLPNQTATMEMRAIVTGGTPGEVLILQLTDTGFMQTGSNSFAEQVSGTITGPGSASFQPFKDFTNTPFGTSGATPGKMGPFFDLGFGQSMATTVQDSSPYSMTQNATIVGGDVTFDFLSTDGPGQLR